MGIAELKISFKEEKRKALEGASTGVVLLILKESTISGIREYEQPNDIVDGYTEENKKYIEDAFIGNVQDVRVGTGLVERYFTPSKVIVYSLATSDTLDNALEIIKNYEFNYICMPDASDSVENPKLIEFIKKNNEDGFDSNLVIVTSKASNSADVIEFFTDDIKSDKTLKAKNLLPFISGVCAGTPLTQSITYCAVPFLDSIPKKTDDEISSLINSGKVVLIKKAGKVRIARGVTSLTEPQRGKGDSFKKIKLVRTYKFINNSIKKAISNYYIGKVSNNYDNKCLLISEIQNYLSELASSGMIEKGYSVEIDIEANKKYLKSKGIDITGLSHQQLKEANTGSKVFLAITIKAVDAMEDFYININV